MFSINSLEDLSLLRETVEMECKLAQGQSGQGEVPKDFWPTYSAMANAHGGVVLLGVREGELLRHQLGTVEGPCWLDVAPALLGQPSMADVVADTLSAMLHFEFNPAPGRMASAVLGGVVLVIAVAAIWFTSPIKG